MASARILIVDDEALVRWSLRERLTAEDYDVFEAGLASEAFERLSTTELDLGSWRIPAGCVAGGAASWQGRVGGRTLVELNVRWKKAPVLEPDWQIQDGYTIEVQGLPTIRSTLQFLPPPDFQAKSLADFMVIGHIMTAMPAINAIPRVVAAPPGIVTYTDLPLPLPRGLVRS